MEYDINKIEIKFIKGKGPGGQNVNKRNNTVQLIVPLTALTSSVRAGFNKPIIIKVGTERKQYQNKKVALKLLDSIIKKATHKKAFRNMLISVDIKLKQKVFSKYINKKRKEKKQNRKKIIF